MDEQVKIVCRVWDQGRSVGAFTCLLISENAFHAGVGRREEKEERQTSAAPCEESAMGEAELQAPLLPPVGQVCLSY
jgi:hypothetical protein